MNWIWYTFLCCFYFHGVLNSLTLWNTNINFKGNSLRLKSNYISMNIFFLLSWTFFLSFLVSHLLHQHPSNFIIAVETYFHPFIPPTRKYTKSVLKSSPTLSLSLSLSFPFATKPFANLILCWWDFWINKGRQYEFCSQSEKSGQTFNYIIMKSTLKGLILIKNKQKSGNKKNERNFVIIFN